MAYISVFLIKKKKYYCIWHSDDIDYFEHIHNELVWFQSRDKLEKYCDVNHIELVSEDTYDDIDYFAEWIQRDFQQIEPDLFLNFWNTVQDLAYSISEDFIGNHDGEENQIVQVYQKLFWGCNLISLRGKKGKYYNPSWSMEEKGLLRNVVEDGLRIISKAFQVAIL